MFKRRDSVRRSKNTKFLNSLQFLGLALPAGGGLILAMSPSAQAFQLYDGSQYNNNLEINLNFTADYIGQYRVGHPSNVLTSGSLNANGNDGDANLRHGVIGNIFEVVPVLDIKDGASGAHFSGEFFVNTVYLGTTKNNQTSTINPALPKSNDFATETRTANGLNGRLLDAFVYDSWNFGKQQLTLKAGQQTLFWGQSLFSVNGISGGQAPLDVVQAQNLVNPQSQQVFLPVGQIVVTYQPNSTYTLQGYYQYQWEPYAFQGVGSFFSGNDVIGPGGQREVLPFPGSYANRTRDVSPRPQNGQFGLSVQAQYGNFDLGLFGLRYDAKTPAVANSINLALIGKTPVIGSYTVIYPRDIWLFGASGSTTIGATNVAGEVSVRTHDPLATQGPDTLSGAFIYNANGSPSYPVGNVLVGLASAIYGSPALKLDPGGVTITGEVEYDKVLGVTANKALLAPNRSSASANFDVEAIPAYFEVLPRLELQFPVSVSYDFAGNSQAQANINHGTGTYSAGIEATYRTTWSATLSYVGNFGKPGAPLAPEVSFTADRSYLELGLQHTF